ncbi:SpvB/TcaC N-terminal domain-containing protein [Rhizobium brockwellii]|uniref:SpvB/TcaC N-terminal domain-containing protein n=1 Tax=Rhizobium brockwellii TaxID=3019932 RepID=UPI003F9B4186
MLRWMKARSKLGYRLIAVVLQLVWLVQSSFANSFPQALTYAKVSPAALDRIFVFPVDIDLESISASYIEYEAFGAKNSTPIRRIINGHSWKGGHTKSDDLGWAKIVDEFSTSELIRGNNLFKFGKNDFGQDFSVSNVKLQLIVKGYNNQRRLLTIDPSAINTFQEPAKHLFHASLADPASSAGETLNSAGDLKIVYPRDGEYFKDRALVTGLVSKRNGRWPKVRLDGSPIPLVDGAFETILSLASGKLHQAIPVVATYDDGYSVAKNFQLYQQIPASKLSSPKASYITLTTERPTNSVFGADWSLAESSQLSRFKVSCLRNIDAPESSDFINITDAECVSFGIENLDGQSEIKVVIPVARSWLPVPANTDSAKVIAFNSVSKAWSIVPDSFLDVQNSRTVATLHDRVATVMGGVQHVPNLSDGQPLSTSNSQLDKLNDLDPLAGHAMVQPPTPNPFGSATLKFPLLLRPVRGANQPRAELNYDSLRGNGLAGDGWNIDVPAISVETKWGVPEYSDTLETETYNYMGEELVGLTDNGHELPPAYRNNFIKNNLNRTELTFHLRKDDQFIEFRRLGDRPHAYGWELIYKNGNREYYGWDPATWGPVADASLRKKSSNPAFPALNAPIYKWAITASIDPDGNTIKYKWRPRKEYENCSPTLPAPCQTSLEIEEIIYNDHVNGLVQIGKSYAPSRTAIRFGWDKRDDRTSNARFGVLEEQKDRLQNIAVTYIDDSGNEQEFSKYLLEYLEPSVATLQKSLLSAITVTVPPDRYCAANGGAAPGNCIAGENQRTVNFTYYDGSDPSLNSFSSRPSGFDTVNTKLEIDQFDTLDKYIGGAFASLSPLGAAVSTGSGAGTYHGWSPIPNKAPSFGAKTGYSQRLSSGRSALVDLTGDGLPDVVVASEKGLEICPAKRDGQLESYPADSCKFALIPTSNVALSSESSNSVSIGGEAHIASNLIFGGAYSDNRSSLTTFFSDVDGNGLIDFILNGNTWFNQGVDNIEGRVRFSKETGYVQPLNVGVDSLAVAQLRDFYKAVRNSAANTQAKFPPIDIVHSWMAPLTGIVGVSGLMLSTSRSEAKTNDTIISVERSRTGSVSKCAETSAIKPGARAVWASKSTQCNPTSPNEIIQFQTLSAKIPDEKVLLLSVNKGDVLYFREVGIVPGKVDTGIADISVIYASTSGNAMAGDVADKRYHFVSDSINSLKDWIPSDLLKCDLVPTGNSLTPRCNQYGESPYAFNLSKETILSTVAADDLVIRPASLGLGSTNVAIDFSGAVEFPAGSQPMKIVLLSTEQLATADTGATAEYRGGLIDDASDLILEKKWAKEILTVLPGSCAKKPSPIIQGLTLECIKDITGRDFVRARFDHVAFTICNVACDPQTEIRFRLEMQPQSVTRKTESHFGVIGALEGNRRALSAADTYWSEVPRLTYRSTLNAPDAVPGGPYDALRQAAANNPVSQSLILSPLFRGRFKLTLDPDLVGPDGTGSYYQRREIEKERIYISNKNNALGVAEFPDPVIGSEGYRLPGDLAKCHPVNGLCEFRLSHVFFTDYPRFDETAPQAFSFNIDLYVNGELTTLNYLGTVPKVGCGDNPLSDYPSAHLERSTDCGLENSWWIMPDSRERRQVAGIQFILNDGNRVKGRELIYSFLAKPSDIVHFDASVRPNWNPAIVPEDFKSPAARNSWDATSIRCNPTRPSSYREIKHLLIDVGDSCRAWATLRSTEIRLSVEGGLGLGDAAIHRKDFARLFVPIGFAEEHNRLEDDPPGPLTTSLRVTTDFRGWARFATKVASGKLTKPYAEVQFAPKRTEQPWGPAAGRVGVDCSGNDESKCKSSSDFAVSLAPDEDVFPFVATYWVEDRGDLNKIDNFIPGAPFAKVSGFDYADLSRGRTCAVSGKRLTECFVGPDLDMWMALGPRSGRFRPIAQHTGRLGPDNLEDIVPETLSGTSSGGITPFIPVPVLYSEGSSLSARVSAISSVRSDTATKTLYLDMNGDGYPDPIVEGNIFPTGPTGISRNQWLATPNSSVKAGLNRTNKSRMFDVSASIGGGGQPTAALSVPSTGDGYLGQTVGNDTARGVGTEGPITTNLGQRSPDAPFGLSLGLNGNAGVDYSPSDFRDINGDGLPDKIFPSEPSYFPDAGRRKGQVNVAFNLGYEFSAPVSIQLPDTPHGASASGGLGFTLGYGDGNGGWSGGLSANRSAGLSRTSLVDMDGDGISDLVVPEQGNFKVYLNRGGEFAKDPENLPIAWNFKDLTASESGVIDAGATFAPTFPCAPLACFIIPNPGFKFEQTLARSIVAMQDLNGDGLLDFASTSGFYQGYSGGVPKLGYPTDKASQKYLNPLGKRNKLKSVTNSSGSEIHLDYALFGNEVRKIDDGVVRENPKGIWGLSEVSIDDGYYPKPSADDGDDRLSIEINYENGNYDRQERMFLGFKDVHIRERGANCSVVDGGPSRSCSGGALLRRTHRQYLNESLYVRGLLAREEAVIDREPATAIRLRDFVYDLWAFDDTSTALADCPAKPDARRDTICFDKFGKARAERIKLLANGVWDSALQRHYMPRLRMVREVTLEGRNEESNDALRSMHLYDYDKHGNVTVLNDFGQIANAQDPPPAEKALDDYRVDLTYASVRSKSKFANPNDFEGIISDRVSRALIKKGLEPGFDADKTLRFSEATYTEQTGHLKTQCAYLRVPPALYSIEVKQGLCSAIDNAGRETATSPWDKLISITAKFGMSASELVTNTVNDYGPFGNVLSTTSPFNSRGDWIERQYDYGEDAFALIPTKTVETHCRSSGVPNTQEETACRYANVAQRHSLRMAQFTSTAATNDRFGTVERTTDINANSLYYHYDNWGRNRTVISSWSTRNSGEPYIAAATRSACKDLKLNEDSCRILASASYERAGGSASQDGVWGAVLNKYVLPDLYAEGRAQDDKAVLAQATIADGLGRIIQQSTEATACVEKKGRRPSDDVTTHRNSGPPELCGSAEQLDGRTVGEAPIVVSGWTQVDALGRTTREFYPRGVFPVSGIKPEADVALLHEPELNDSSPSSTYRYDSINRPISIKLPDGNQLAFSYDLIAAPQTLSRLRTVVQDARCAVKAYDRNARGLIRSVWELQGKLYGLANSSGHQTDTRHRVPETYTCEDGGILEKAFADKLAGWLADPGAAAVADMLAETRYTYDQLNQLTQVKRPIVDHANGRQTGFGDEISAQYDLLGRRIELSDPNRGDEVLALDPMGNVISRDQISLRPVAPRKITYLYDANRISGIRYDAAFKYMDVDYRYDSFPTGQWEQFSSVASTRAWLDDETRPLCRNCNGRITAIKDASGLVVQNYDVLGHPSETWRSILYQGREKARAYYRNDFDAWGTLKSQTLKDIMPDNPSPDCLHGETSPDANDYNCDFKQTISYGYDQGGRQVRVSLGDEDVGAIVFDELGSVFARWSGDGTITDYTYDDKDHRLNHLRTALWNAQKVQEVKYAYDAAGNISKLINEPENAPATSFAYKYDGSNRLVGTIGKHGPDNLAEAYAYDLRHRMLSKGSMNYAYEPLASGLDWRPVDAPKQISSQSSTLTQHYDGWGDLEGSNLLDNGGIPQEARKLDWDPEGRLATVRLSKPQGDAKNGALSEQLINFYVYDSAGQRVIKHEGLSATNDSGWLQLYVTPFYTKRWNGPAQIQISLAGQRLATVDLALSAQQQTGDRIYYYSHMPNGSTNAVTRQVMNGEHEGVLDDQMAYMPFGEPVQPVTQSRQARMPQFAFSGKEEDRDTRYSDFGGRLYDANNALWLSPDPLQTDLRFSARSSLSFASAMFADYSHAWNNPISFADPDGRVPGMPDWTLGFGAAGWLAGSQYGGVSFTIACSPTGPGAALCGAGGYIGGGTIGAIGGTAVGAALDLYEEVTGKSLAGPVFSMSESAGEGEKGNPPTSEQGIDKEQTPATHPDMFEPVRGTKAKKHKETGEIMVKDPLHKAQPHYEVYKNKKMFDKNVRDRDVWADGRPKRKL